MKNFRTSLITVILGLLLVGYIYFFERGPVKKKEEADTKVKVFENFVADDITEIKLENLATTLNAEKSPLDIIKDEKGIWQIVSPKRLKADESMVRTLLAGVGDFNPETSVDNPMKLSDFGLDKPVSRSTFKTKAGVSFQLLVGDKNAAGSLDYIKSGSKNTVYLLPVSSVDGLLKGLNNFRDHTFIKTDMVLAKKIRVTRGDKLFEFVKDKDNLWNIEAPLRDTAEESRVRDLLNTLNSLRADEFVKDHPDSLSPYGLGKPRAKVEVWPADGGPSKTILLGKKKDKTANYYIKGGDVPTVCLVGENIEKVLDIKVDDYRNKSVMKFDASLVKTLTVKRNGKDTVYSKDAKGQWTSLGREKAPEEAGSLIAQLSQTTISSFADKKAQTGLKNASLVVEVGMNDGTSRLFRFGNREKEQVYLGSDKNKDVYLVSSSVVAQMESYFNTILTPVPTAALAPPAKK